MSHFATFIVFSLPWIIEVVIETYFENEKKVSVNHFWTAVGRGALILMMAITVGKMGGHCLHGRPALDVL